MYAIIEAGGKQYRVEKGDVIDIELLDIEGNDVEFKNVLFFYNGSATKVGLPHVAGCVVRGELVQQVSGPKVVSFKYKKRHNYRRAVGHRQKYLRVKITGIEG